jgi:hypothetical protein
MAGPYDILMLMPFGDQPEPPVGIQLERFVRSGADPTHPEDFVRSQAALEIWREIFLRSAPELEALGGDWVATKTALDKLVELWIRSEVDFGLSELMRYVRSDAALQWFFENYLRSDVEWQHIASYVRSGATLSRADNLADHGDAPAPGQPGLISRQYLSVAAVKKEIA